MKFEKIALALAVTAFLVAANHQALAATKTINTSGMTVKTLNKNAKSKIAKNKQKTTKISKAKSSSIDQEIAAEVRAFEMAAVSNPVKSENVMMDIKNSSSTSTKLENVAPKANVFSGAVSFTMGNDSNIDPDKTKINGSFFQIDPSLGYKSGNWSGSFGASIKDFTNQEQSDLFKQNEASASTTYTGKLSTATTSTTTLSALYHDEKWPDYINTDAGYDNDGNTNSMPIRYADFKLEQKLGFSLGSVNTEIGGLLTHRDAYSIYSDWAPDVLGERLFEKDYNEMKAFGAITLSAASFLDLSLKPSIKQIKYLERQGRQATGWTGGMSESAPAYELITSELAFDVGFKFGESNITPTALIGQVSDEALGAEDNSYYGFGLSSTLVLDKATKLTLTPNVMYKKISYNNWTDKIIPVGETRVDDEISTGVNASIQLAKNFGIGAGYSMTLEKSNKVADTSENYRQEIVSSALTFSF